MKTTVDSTDALHKSITVEIPWEMIQEEMDRSFKELSGQVSIKGFRKGKVPKNVIRKRFGPRVQEEVLARMITDSYEAALIQNRIRAVSKPELERGSFKEGETYQYVARVEVSPEIEVKEIRFEVKRKKAKIAAKAVTEEIDKLRDKKAVLVPIDGRTTAQDGDTAIIDYSSTQDGKPLEGGSQTNHPLNLGSGKALPGFEEHVMGMEVGATKEFDLEFPKEWGPPHLAGKKVQFQVTLQSLKNRELPEADDEFVKDLGRDDCKSMTELKKIVKDGLAEQEQAKLDQEAKDELTDKLLEANPFPVPPTLVERRQESLAKEMELYLSQQGINLQETGLNRDKMKKDLQERAEKEIKTALLLSAIAVREKVEVGEVEIDAHLQNLADKTGTNLARIKAIYDDPSAREGLRSQLLQEKVLDYLLEPSNMKPTGDSGGSGDFAEAEPKPDGEEK
jgi:trigger factor